MKHLWAWGLGAAGLLFTGFAFASGGKAGVPAGTKAKVVSNVGNSIRIRSAPSLQAPQVGDAINGTTVTVLQTGIAPTDGSGGEWWQIDTGTVTGYSRGIDPAGYHNFQPV